ncbi:MAG: gliding motility-associated C-terminal domain-containing protein [Saprospiraceae bacterium]
MLLFHLVDINAQCSFEKAPPGQICSTALPISGVELNGYTSTLPIVYAQTQIQEDGSPWGGLCNGNGSAQNIIWFSFVPCSSTVELEITVGSCYVLDTLTGNNLGSPPNAGLQVGLFKGCTNSEYIDCSASPTSGSGMTGTFRVKGNTFVPGEPAYLYLDGYNLQLTTITVCDFNIRVISGIDTSPVSAPDASTLRKGDITGPVSVSCQDHNTPISFDLTAPECAYIFNPGCGPSIDFNPVDSLCYVWSISPSDGRYFSNQDSVGSNADIVFTKSGIYTISADVFLNPAFGTTNANAACAAIRTWTVEVLDSDTITAAPIYVCPGEIFDYCGQQVTSNSTLYCHSSPCEIIKQEFIFSTSRKLDHGVIYICPSDNYTFQNNTYTQDGYYEVVDDSDCTLLHSFTLERLKLTTYIDATIDTLTCRDMESAISVGITASHNGLVTYNWLDGNNTSIGQGSSATVNQPGNYKVDVQFQYQGATCTNTEFFTISSDVKLPDANLNVPTYRCYHKKFNYTLPIITAVSTDPLENAYWTSPSGVNFNGLNIKVDSIDAISGNPYVLTLVGKNGCITTKEIVVPINLKKAKLTIEGDDILNCYKPFVNNMKVNSDLVPKDIRWYRILNGNSEEFITNGPDKFALDNNTFDKPGKYVAEVVAEESYCISDIHKDVTEDKIAPHVDLGLDKKWHCNTTSINLDAVVNNVNAASYYWSSIDGTLGQNNTKNSIALNTGSYILEVLNTENGCRKSDEVRIEKETNVPTAIIAVSQDISCHNEANGRIEITDVIGGFAPYHYTLNGNTVQNSISNLTEGIYTLEVSDMNDCKYSIQTSIFEPEPFVLDVPQEIEIALFESIGLSLISNYTDVISVTWQDSKGEIISRDFEFDYTSTESDIIEVIAISSNGCESRAKITVKVDNELKLFFPNIFTPNGDGVNDRFVVWKNKIPAVLDEMHVFDRFGNEVFNAKDLDFNDPNTGWDGSFRDSHAEDGTYVYICKYTDYTGAQQLVKGDITLLRK